MLLLMMSGRPWKIEIFRFLLLGSTSGGLEVAVRSRSTMSVLDSDTDLASGFSLANELLLVSGGGVITLVGGLNADLLRSGKFSCLSLPDDVIDGGATVVGVAWVVLVVHCVLLLSSLAAEVDFVVKSSDDLSIRRRGLRRS